MGSFAPVIEAYDDAREAGLSRADAFMRAIAAFRALHPHVAAAEAGSEVARILLHAATAARIAQGSDAMPRPAISW